MAYRPLSSWSLATGLINIALTRPGCGSPGGERRDRRGRRLTSLKAAAFPRRRDRRARGEPAHPQVGGDQLHQRPGHRSYGSPPFVLVLHQIWRGPRSFGAGFAVTYLATGAAAAVSGRIAERIGLVRSVVSVRLLAVLFLVLLPDRPLLLDGLDDPVVRSALNRGTIGTRQALTVSLVRDERRGFASAINSISGELPQRLGPADRRGDVDAGISRFPSWRPRRCNFCTARFLDGSSPGVEPGKAEPLRSGGPSGATPRAPREIHAGGVFLQTKVLLPPRSNHPRKAGPRWEPLSVSAGARRPMTVEEALAVSTVPTRANPPG